MKTKKKIFNFFSSIKLAVFIFVGSIFLIFIGTIDQRTHGIFYIMDKYFYTWIVYSESDQPIFLGGYFWGWALFINLILGNWRYTRFNRKKIGAHIIHFGLLMLILGVFITSISQVETRMSIREGERSNYSESQYKHELVFIPVHQPNTYYSIIEKELKKNITKTINITKIATKKGNLKQKIFLDDIKIFIKKYYKNSNLIETSTPIVSNGLAKDYRLVKLPYDSSEKTKSFAGVIIEIKKNDKTLGSYILSSRLNQTDKIKINNIQYEVSLRNRRDYLPFYIELKNFSFDRYRGTNTPRNYSSEIIIHDGINKQKTLIYMNSPLRKAGKTFYQASFFKDETGTILQVVENKGWLIPYISTIIISLGMIIQFLSHLIKFLNKRKKNA